MLDLAAVRPLWDHTKNPKLKINPLTADFLGPPDRHCRMHPYIRFSRVLGVIPPVPYTPRRSSPYCLTIFSHKSMFPCSSQRPSRPPRDRALLYRGILPLQNCLRAQETSKRKINSPGRIFTNGVLWDAHPGIRFYPGLGMVPFVNMFLSDIIVYLA